MSGPVRTSAKDLLLFVLTPPWLLAGWAVILMLPVIMGPPRLTDSHWINIVWSEQFTAAVRAGTLWPRWLALSHGGLGSPVFFFYGPGVFWVAAGFGLLGLEVWPALVATAVTASGLSGMAMYHYLRPVARRPALGAALYMALPYHLLDFGMRGALAETGAYLFLPLIALGVRCVARGRGVVLATAYAGLIVTHLPTALLASIFLLPLLAIREHGRDRSTLLRCGMALAAGLALAAPYLAPALLLQPYASVATMTGTTALQAAQWTVFSHDPRIIAGLIVIGAVAATGVPIALTGSMKDTEGWLILAGLAVALGVAPMLWTFPVLAKVQFPWRLLAVTDFAIASRFARSIWPVERLVLAASPAMIASMMILAAPTSRAREPAGVSLDRHPDVIEYLPPQLHEHQGPFSRRALGLANAVPRPAMSGGMTLLPRFAFPSWAVLCQGHPAPQTAQPGTGLILAVGRDCRMRRRVTGQEVLGWLLFAGGVGWLAASWLSVRTSRSPRGRVGHDLPHAARDGLAC